MKSYSQRVGRVSLHCFQSYREMMERGTGVSMQFQKEKYGFLGLWRTSAFLFVFLQ